VVSYGRCNFFCSTTLLSCLQPLEWMQRTGNVKVRFMHDVGGHFPAWENPDLLAEDIWSFFGDGDLSGTKIFGSRSNPLVTGREL
jgi:hypothetical protein